jgi:hypothetical protein
MAKNESIIKLKGNIGGLSFYESGGENIVKMSNGPDKERLMSDPAYKRTRENMQEFGGAAKCGKAFRTLYAEVIKTMGETYLAGRLTGLMKKINSMGTGARGERSFEFTNFKELFIGFEFNRVDTFSSAFYAPYDALTYNADRDIVTWTLPEFDTRSYVNPPEGSTHFKLVLAAGILSNYVYNAGSEEYEPSEATVNTKKALAISNEIALNGTSGGVITLTADIGIGAALPADVIVPAAVGIIFYQQINAQLYELASGNAMRIESVG